MPPIDNTALSQAALHEGLDNLAIGITLFDADLRLVYLNPTVLDIYNVPEELLRPGFSLEGLLRFNAERGDYGPGDVEQQIRERIALAQSRKPHRFERIRPDGKVIEVNGIPLPNGGLINTYTDITRLRTVSQSLTESEERYQELVNLAPVLICVHTDGILRYINPTGARMLGAVKPDQLIGKRIDTIVHPDFHRDLSARLKKLERDTGALPRLEHRYLRLDGSEIDVEVAVRPFRQQGRIAFMTVAREITQRKRAERQMRSLLEASPVGVAVINSQGGLLFSNPAFSTLFEHDQDQSGAQFADFLAQPGQFDDIKQHLMKHDELHNQELDLKRTSGTPFCALVTAKRLPFEEIPAYFLWIVDISEQKSIRQRLSHLAHYDELTELPNRRLFLDHTKRAIALANRTRQRCALLYFDLDGFKPINDSLGHEAGDRLLCEIAERFQRCLRSNDLVARIGGDEFGALLMDIRESQDAECVAQKIIDVAAEPFSLNDRQVAITISVGIACFPGDAVSVDELMAQADRAMYVAKQSGKGHFRLHDASGPALPD